MSKAIVQVESFPEALQFKAVEHWLALGEVEEALRELDALPGPAHPSVLRMQDLIRRLYGRGAA